MPKRPQAGSAAAGSDADAKKAKPHVCVSSHAIRIPPNTEPESRILPRGHESRRAARRANEDATSEEAYGEGDYDKFAEPFEAAVASAFAETGGPVSLTEVITAMTDATGKIKMRKALKERFVWDGFKQDRWQISRAPKGAVSRQVAFPKDAARPKESKKWRFSPSQAESRPVELSCEPSPRSSAGCVVC